LSPPLKAATRGGVAEKRPIDLTVKIFAGIFRNRRRIHFFESVVIVIPLLQHERHPTDLVFNADESKFGISLHDSKEDQFKKRIDDFLELQIHAAPIGLDARSLIPEHSFLVVAMSGEDMQIHRHVEILGSRPELIVMFRMKRQVRMRRLPDDRSLKAGLRATLQLLYRPVDVINRDRSDTNQTIGSNVTIIKQPIVVRSETGLLKLCVVHGEGGQQIGWVKHPSAWPVGLHLLDPTIWVRPSGMGLEAFPDFELGKNRSFFSERRCDSLLYGIGWFHHMGVRRNQHLAACIISIASHKIFPPLAICLYLWQVYHQRPQRVNRAEARSQFRFSSFVF